MKINYFTKLLAVFITILLIGSCTSEFIAPNITKATMVLNSPPNNFKTKDGSIVFWWNELKGAEHYHLQVVDSNFSYIRRIILDSNVTGTKFSYTLSPGNYQWRMWAVNNSGNSLYTSARNLSIDTTSNLANLTLNLVSPSDNYVTNQTAISFKWAKLSAADDYRFQLINTSTSGTITDVVLQTDSFNYNLPQGQYKWQVRAQNTTSNSAYAFRNITIDLTAPPLPTFTAPANSASVTNPVTLAWGRDASAMADSLYIYPDSLVSAPTYSNYTTSTSYDFTGLSNHTYFWRLKSKDNAGNWTIFTATRKFYVQ